MHARTRGPASAACDATTRRTTIVLQAQRERHGRHEPVRAVRADEALRDVEARVALAQRSERVDHGARRVGEHDFDAEHIAAHVADQAAPPAFAPTRPPAVGSLPRSIGRQRPASAATRLMSDSRTPARP